MWRWPDKGAEPFGLSLIFLFLLSVAEELHQGKKKSKNYLKDFFRKILSGLFLFLFASPPSSATLVGAGKKETKRSP